MIYTSTTATLIGEGGYRICQLDPLLYQFNPAEYSKGGKGSFFSIRKELPREPSIEMAPTS